MFKRILIAEDDLYYRKMLINVFNQSNYELVTAIDGATVIEYICENLFDLAILDYHLPKKKGDEILKIMQKKFIEIPVIVISADDSLKTERIVRSYGPAYFFVKPFSIDNMRKVVEKIFALKKSTT